MIDHNFDATGPRCVGGCFADTPYSKTANSDFKDLIFFSGEWGNRTSTHEGAFTIKRYDFVQNYYFFYS